MTLEQLTAGLAEKDDGIAKEWFSHRGVRYAVWQTPHYWFCAVDGADGCGVAEDRESAVTMAKAKIEEGE